MTLWDLFPLNGKPFALKWLNFTEAESADYIKSLGKCVCDHSEENNPHPLKFRVAVLLFCIFLMKTDRNGGR